VLVLPKPGTGFATLLGVLDVDDLGEVGAGGWRAVSVPVTTTAAELVETLEAATAVEAAQLDYGYHPQGSTLPSGGGELASYVPTQDELLRIGLAAATARATGEGLRVGIVDTGILELDGVEGSIDSDGYDHFSGDEDPTDDTDGLDQDGDQLVDEIHGHGSFVASLVLAIAPDARIVPFRAIDADGRTSSSVLANAVIRAAWTGVDVINLSVAVGYDDQVLRQAVYAAQQNYGVQVISAAGNAGADVGAPWSSISDMVVVTAVDADDVLADFASYGTGVDLVAPGVDLYGAYPESPGTAIWSGTSFSTALVTGAFLLVLEQNPTWSRGDVVSRLTSTSVDVESSNASALEGKLGSGLLDLDAATESD
jgi:thermitase